MSSSPVSIGSPISDLASPLSMSPTLGTEGLSSDAQNSCLRGYLANILDPPTSTPAPDPRKRFYYADGSVQFLVDGHVYKVHRSIFERQSSWFRNRFQCSPDDMLPGWEYYVGLHGDHFFVNRAEGCFSLSRPYVMEKSGGPIVLENTTLEEFDAFLSILYPDDYDSLDLTTQTQWASVLKLATRWSFVSIRSLAIRRLEALLTDLPMDRLLLARACHIDRWADIAIRKLCQRSQPLGVDELCRMEIEDIALICAVREGSNAKSLTCDTIDAEIQEWQAAKRERAEKNKHDLVRNSRNASIETRTADDTRAGSQQKGDVEEKEALNGVITGEDDAMHSSPSVKSAALASKTRIVAQLKAEEERRAAEARAAAARIAEERRRREKEAEGQRIRAEKAEQERVAEAARLEAERRREEAIRRQREADRQARAAAGL